MKNTVMVPVFIVVPVFRFCPVAPAQDLLCVSRPGPEPGTDATGQGGVSDLGPAADGVRSPGDPHGFRTTTCQGKLPGAVCCVVEPVVRQLAQLAGRLVEIPVGVPP